MHRPADDLVLSVTILQQLLRGLRAPNSNKNASEPVA
jgi:hypothetical protein